MALRFGRGVAGELLVDPLYHGWRRSFPNVTPMYNAVFMRERIEEEFKDSFEERCFSVILNTTVQSHPISEYDVININGFIPEQFEDTTDDQILKLMVDAEFLCSVHKANIPIAKYRNAIADQETDDGPGLRCAQCAKIITCKISSKR